MVSHHAQGSKSKGELLTFSVSLPSSFIHGIGLFLFLLRRFGLPIPAVHFVTVSCLFVDLTQIGPDENEETMIKMGKIVEQFEPQRKSKVEKEERNTKEKIKRETKRGMIKKEREKRAKVAHDLDGVDDYMRKIEELGFQTQLKIKTEPNLL